MAPAYASLFVLFLPLTLHCRAAIYNITSSGPLFPNESLVSSGQILELGFFRANGTDDQYVGMWYTNMNPFKVVWVANRGRPLPYADRSASLTVGTDGNLRLLDGQGNTFWSTNVSSKGSSAILLDTGNLVLRDQSSGSNLWESFDYPGDTLLQTMEIGINTITGTKQNLTSWRSESDPSAGSFVGGITSDTPPQFFIWMNGSVPYWRSGPWDKSRFIGLPQMVQTYSSIAAVQQNIQQGTTYFTLRPLNNTHFVYMYISSNGSLTVMDTNDRAKGWTLDSVEPMNQCGFYGTCGPFGVCNILSSPICSCLEGFVPSSVEEWRRGNWTGGCIRETQLNCERNATATTSSTNKQDSFLKMSSMKLPDASYWLDIIRSAQDCETWCLSNCSCLAYSYVDTIGCMTWSQKLMDIVQFPTSGEDLYLRLADISTPGNSKGNRALIISLTSICSIIILGSAIYALYKRRAKQNRSFVKIPRLFGHSVSDNSSDMPKGNALKEQLKSEDGHELPIFNFCTIQAATNNFSIKNKLGQGGFGPVYEGKLQDGTDVAVKRLSSNSGQGVEEFKNEILLISKLQHRNLVRLIGCCIEVEENILVYEFLPNKSLDTFLFDPVKKAELSWDKRFQIIQGIARGLLYLHRDSQLRVIHRDLKAGNILLDEKLNPKISDFGLARMFQGTQDLVNTRRVVGTLGYMAPEYAMGGIFSEKSDMYSFGVLLLEIISSKKNTSFCNEEDHINLLSYTWELWREGRPLDLLDEALIESSSLSEVEKCIQIGLLCVQDHAADRPNMSSVVQMLSGGMNLLPPKEPTFTFQVPFVSATPLHQETVWSANEVSDSILEGR